MLVVYNILMRKLLLRVNRRYPFSLFRFMITKLRVEFLNFQLRRHSGNGYNSLKLQDNHHQILDMIIYKLQHLNHLPILY